MGSGAVGRRVAEAVGPVPRRPGFRRLLLVRTPSDHRQPLTAVAARGRLAEPPCYKGCFCRVASAPN